MKKIVFADDDPGIREVVRILLTREGYEVLEACSGFEAVDRTDESVDLIILDVMMPGLSGVDACVRIREKTSAPILFLTAKSQDKDKTAGFAAGGDDYLVKPFSGTELTDRVGAMLRRYLVYQGKEEEQTVIKRLGLTIHIGSNEVLKNGEQIWLTDLEYQILLLLAANRDKTFTTQDIYEEVWKEPYLFTSNNTVMVHIRNLRKKLEDDPQNPRYVKNVWGRGYRIG